MRCAALCGAVASGRLGPGVLSAPPVPVPVAPLSLIALPASTDALPACIRARVRDWISGQIWRPEGFRGSSGSSVTLEGVAESRQRRWVSRCRAIRLRALKSHHFRGSSNSRLCASSCVGLKKDRTWLREGVGLSSRSARCSWRASGRGGAGPDTFPWRVLESGPAASRSPPKAPEVPRRALRAAACGQRARRSW